MALPITPEQRKTSGNVGLESIHNTYSCAKVGLVPAASATDIFTITGAANSIVKVRKIAISGVAGTAGIFAVLLIKRSTAGSGGTSTGSPVAVPHDSASPVSVVTLKTFTANPTVGTIIDNIRAGRLALPLATASAIDRLVWDFGSEGKPIVLSTASEQLAINLNAVSISSGVLDIFCEWTEE